MEVTKEVFKIKRCCTLYHRVGCFSLVLMAALMLLLCEGFKVVHIPGIKYVYMQILMFVGISVIEILELNQIEWNLKVTTA